MNALTIIDQKTLGLRSLMLSIIAPNLHQKREGLPRPMTTFLKRHFGKKDLIGVEIGVSHGVNAESMLRVLRIKKLFLIDPYKPYLQNRHLLTSSANSFRLAKVRLMRFRGKIQFIVKKSKEALSFIPDDLDFVYIDGNHAYEFVKKDIELYYPKIKTGGVLGGHDFSLSTKGVFKAVMEFVTDNKLKLHGEDTDWWVVKK